jgi:hypothetical protein
MPGYGLSSIVAPSPVITENQADILTNRIPGALPIILRNRFFMIFFGITPVVDAVKHISDIQISIAR